MRVTWPPLSTRTCAPAPDDTAWRSDSEATVAICTGLASSAADQAAKVSANEARRRKEVALARLRELEVAEREVSADTALASEKLRLDGLNTRWEQEKALVDELLALRAKLRNGAQPVDAAPAPADGEAPEAAKAPEAAVVPETNSAEPVAGNPAEAVEPA